MRQPVPFGKYLLLDRISVGGMAEVFKAKSYGVEGFEKIIAIKRILPTMGEDRDFIKMFIDEAKIAGQLAHANICQIFELGRIDGSHFIAMEYIWGKDLLQIQNRLRKIKQQMPISMACFSIAKVLEGLDYAHRKRDPLGRPLEIVHRDCSPQNVLVSYEGEVKVIDFGIAKATSRNSRTMAGVLKGKFGYMSPEQVRGLPLDRRSDIFALGTMLYECLTGERLFQGETDFSTLEKVRNVDIAPPRSINPAIPEAVEKVILKALAKDVEERYQWCSEMLADLQAYLMSQDVVFTAKSLSGWLKEVFSGEIERERQQLEQYKRVGRDGLIQGLPAAEAKLDVNEHLGEGGAPEGDATTLGGPNFDDIELAAGASPDVGPAPGSPASRPAKRMAADDDSGDFGEEAPTEIFGELGEAPVPQPAAASPSRPISQTPGNKPLKPPPGSRPGAPQPQVPMAASPGVGAPLASHQAVTTPSRPVMPPAGAMDGYAPAHSMSSSAPHGYPQNGDQPPYAPQGFGTPPQPQSAMSGPASAAMGAIAPGMMPLGSQPLGPQGLPLGSQPPPLGGVAPPGGQPNRTVIGVGAPPGLGNYSGGYRPSVPQQSMGGYPQQQPQGYPPPGYAMPGYPGSGQMPGYPMGPGMGAIDPGAVDIKRSTLVRDIGIGVGIAALVLLGFLAVKLFVLDKGDTSGSTQTSTIATVRLSLPAGITADMYIDDNKEKIGTVSDKQEVPVTAGQRRIRLIGPGGAHCDDTVKLEGGKTTTLECTMYAPGTQAGSGSDAVKSDTKTPDTKTPDTKTPDTKAPNTKAPDTKAPDTKAPDTKSTSASTTDTKGAAAIAKVPIDTKTVTPTKTDTKAADTKAADTKAVDTKAAATTKTDAKSNVAATTTTNAATTTKHDDTSKTADAAAVKPADKPDPTKGYLQVFSKPTAKISIDGSDIGMSTPISGHTLSLAPGKHKVTFVIGEDRFTYPVSIKAGVTETMSKDLQ